MTRTEAAPGYRCPLCGGERATLALVLHDVLVRSTDESFPLARCSGCGLLRLHPPPDDTTLNAAYPAHYAPFQRRGVSGRVKSGLERRSVRKLRRYLGAPNTVLDVGCSSGALLAAVRAAGNPRVIGVEPDPDAARAARGRGLDVRVGDLEAAGFADERFDTVVMSHALEHVREPIATLREVARVMRPGGALLLWLPNAASLEARVLRTRWIGYDAPRHLTTFDVATLTRALGRAGFTIADVRHEAIGLEWAWAIRLWARVRWPRAERTLSWLHPLVTTICTPLAIISALLRRGGRVRVIAVRATD
jgi:SAM-dependent methyltransferase